MGMCVELIDHSASPAQGWYFRADFPTEDIRDLKTLLRHDHLTRAGITVLNPVDLLQYLPKVEPLALGGILKRVDEGDPNMEGHFELVDDLAWDLLPRFEWTAIYAQASAGLNDPTWEGYSEKNKRKWRRDLIAQKEKELIAHDKAAAERVEASRKAVHEYEQIHGLPVGSLLQSVFVPGGEDAPGPGSAVSPGAGSDGLGSTMSC